MRIYMWLAGSTANGCNWRAPQRHSAFGSTEVPKTVGVALYGREESARASFAVIRVGLEHITDTVTAINYILAWNRARTGWLNGNGPTERHSPTLRPSTTAILLFSPRAHVNWAGVGASKLCCVIQTAAFSRVNFDRVFCVEQKIQQCK